MAESREVRRAAQLSLALIIGGVRALGPARRPVATVIGSLWYAGAGRTRRRRAAANHRRLAPRLDPRAARRLAHRSYVEYVAMILDAIWAEPLSPEQLRPLLHLRGGEHLDAARGGAVLAVAHFGNWDIAASGAMALGVPLTTVMAPIGPASITELVMISRRRKGLELYTPDQAARGLLRALGQGRKVALMLDVPEAGPTTVVPYCGGPVVVSTVPARIAAAKQVPILPASCWRDSSGWQLVIDPPITVRRGHEQQATAEVAAVLEGRVRRHPEQWYPFHEVYADA